jgi:quercetin dioxygenase-like cupin family protein
MPTFTKFAPGTDSGWHTHTRDISIVVLKGAYLYLVESPQIAAVETLGLIATKFA